MHNIAAKVSVNSGYWFSCSLTCCLPPDSKKFDEVWGWIFFFCNVRWAIFWMIAPLPWSLASLCWRTVSVPLIPEKAYSIIDCISAGKMVFCSIYLLNKLLFPFLNVKDFAFHCVLRNKLVNVNVLLLTNAIDSIHCLAFNALLKK